MDRLIQSRQFDNVALATNQKPFRLVTSTVCRSTTALSAVDAYAHLVARPTPRAGLYLLEPGPGWVTALKFAFSAPTLAALQAATGTARIWGLQELETTDGVMDAAGKALAPAVEIVGDVLMSLTLAAPATAIRIDSSSKLFSSLVTGEFVGLVDSAGLVIDASSDKTRNTSAVVRSNAVLEFDSSAYAALLLEMRSGSATNGMYAMQSSY